MNLSLELPTLPKRLGGQGEVLPAGANHIKNIAKIANAVQCHSWLSGNKNCHEFRFSIVRIVISVSKFTGLWDCLCHCLCHFLCICNCILVGQVMSPHHSDKYLKGHKSPGLLVEVVLKMYLSLSLSIYLSLYLSLSLYFCWACPFITLIKSLFITGPRLWSFSKENIARIANAVQCHS